MRVLHVKYVLVGGGAASSAALEAIRQRDAEGDIVLIGQEVNRAYRRPEICSGFLQGRKSRSDLFTLDDRWFSEHQVELRTGRRAARLDPARRTVTLDSGEEIVFDKLLLATGASAKHLNIPGAQLPNLFYLRNLDDAERLRHGVEKALREGRKHEHGRGRCAVIGGGLLSVELAAALREMGLAVDLIVSASYPWAKFAGDTAGRFITRFLQSRQIAVHANTMVTRLEGDGRVQRVVLSDGMSLDADLACAAIGVMPNKELLRGTSLAAEKAILVNEHCRTSDENIYAAGDCAAMFDPLFGRYRYIDHWSHAERMGRIAGTNMAGGDEAYAEVSRYESEVFGMKVVVWGDGKRVERRVVRGSPQLERPEFVEFGIGGDGRITQVVAVNHGEEGLLELVARRAVVVGEEARLQDPGVGLDGIG